MTAELVLLLAVYALFIMSLFVGKEGAVHTFKNSLPQLSTRIEQNIVTGQGFGTKKWIKPTP